MSISQVDSFKQPEYADLHKHANKIIQCMENQKKAGKNNLWACIAATDCLKERKSLSHCIFKHQKNDFLCKVPRQDMKACYRQYSALFTHSCNQDLQE